MKLELKYPINDLAGNKIGDDMMNVVVANMLCGKTQDIEPIKAMDWANGLYKDGCIEIDETDLDKLSQLIERSEALNIVKSPFLKSIKECRGN